MSRRHQRKTRRRFLSMETLETRRLLITGPIDPPITDPPVTDPPITDPPPQNFANPEDANYDGHVSPADALIVINQLNNPSQSDSPVNASKDINGDGVVSALDALLIINRLNNRTNQSSVPPEQRAIGLRNAIEAGTPPPNMSSGQVQELLDTLENGGHYEVGERYRDGQMININNPSDETQEADAEAEGESSLVVLPSVDAVTENLLHESTVLDSFDAVDPFALFESAHDLLAAELHDSSLWRTFSDSGDDRLESLDRIANRLSDRLAERLQQSDIRDRVAQAVADALQNSDKTIEDVIRELQALRGTLGDARSQIAQLFANLDVDGILEQLGVDLGTLAEAVLSHGRTGITNHEAAIAEFLGRDYLRDLGELLR